MESAELRDHKKVELREEPKKLDGKKLHTVQDMSKNLALLSCGNTCLSTVASI